MSREISWSQIESSLYVTEFDRFSVSGEGKYPESGLLVDAVIEGGSRV